MKTVMNVCGAIVKASFVLGGVAGMTLGAGFGLICGIIVYDKFEGEEKKK